MVKTWRMKAKEAKSVQVTFTLNKMTCPPVKLNNEHLPQADEVKYLGIHLD
jgi:N-acetylglutamate synthase/N-acetylornithine aminotransferase